MFRTLGDFLQVEKWRVLRSNAFASNSLSSLEKLLRRLLRCCNRLKERNVWAVRNVTSGTSVSNRAERPSKTIPNVDGLPRQWTTITLRKCLLWFRQICRLTVREVAKEAGICKRSYQLILTDKLKMCRVAAKFVPRLLTDALLIREFLAKHETIVVHQPPCSPHLAPADFSCSRSWNPH